MRFMAMYFSDQGLCSMKEFKKFHLWGKGVASTPKSKQNHYNVIHHFEEKKQSLAKIFLLLSLSKQLYDGLWRLMAEN